MSPEKFPGLKFVLGLFGVFFSLTEESLKVITHVKKNSAFIRNAKCVDS